MPRLRERRLQTARLRAKRLKNVKAIHIFDPANKFAIKTKFTTILAAGPNGINGWDFLEKNIPRDQNTIIAVNFAVTYGWRFKRPYIVPDMWGVTDVRALTQEAVKGEGCWFPSALTQFRGIRLFNIKVMESCWNSFQHVGPYYTYKSKRLMQGTDVKLHADVIRPGGSVTCSMAQVWGHFIAYNPKPKEQPILLICGADMSGDDYAIGKNKTKEHGKIWNSVHTLGTMCQYLNKTKGKVYAISETKLHDHGYIDYYEGSVSNNVLQPGPLSTPGS